MSSMYRNSESAIDEARQALESHMYRVADKIFDYFEGERQNEMLDKCKQSMAKICKAEAEYKHKQNLVRLTAQHFREQERDRSIKDVYNEVKEKTPACKDDHENHSSYKNLMKVITDGDKRVNNIGESEEEEDDDEELQLTEMTVNTLDPFTKSEMTDPVMSSVCRHTFERKSVMMLLKDKSRTRCPTPGCGWITVGDLVPDVKMKRIIEERQANKD